ncbi:hypothetical protein SAMN04515667_2195 [Formosa sp. Hel1_31_208]|uniref:hypothetical protein n=1 Tax=Formosa sp. Hel1_31_208 TaxID=1798225 RepID=UPI00087C2670|nr:hypothetical protein [Formosa sp. Hel1_31_208]SDS44494.1 hypothetical protein SAMN04515667_2195 [Formosa sp. Hel1_31_208]
MNLRDASKNKKLILSILFDAIGMIPFIDILWAPLSGYLMTKLYKGTKGKLAGIFSFIEEIIPGTDFIPTFTIMWVYTYVFSSETSTEDRIIDIN